MKNTDAGLVTQVKVQERNLLALKITASTRAGTVCNPMGMMSPQHKPIATPLAMLSGVPSAFATFI
jgi:hypothetical protein